VLGPWLTSTPPLFFSHWSGPEVRVHGPRRARRRVPFPQQPRIASLTKSKVMERDFSFPSLRSETWNSDGALHEASKDGLLFHFFRDVITV